MLIRILLTITLILAALSAMAGSHPASRYLRFDFRPDYHYATYQTGQLSFAEHNQLTGSDNYKKEVKLYPFAHSFIFVQQPPNRDGGEDSLRAVSLKACSGSRNSLEHNYEYVSLSAQPQPVQNAVKPGCSQLLFSDGRELYFDKIPSPYKESIDGLAIIELSKGHSSPERGSAGLPPLGSVAGSRLSEMLGGGGGADSDDDRDDKPRKGFFGGAKQQDLFLVGLMPVLEPIAEQIKNGENSAPRLRLSTSLDDGQVKVLLRDDADRLYIRTYSREFIEWEFGISVDPSILPASLPMLTVNQGPDGSDGPDEEFLGLVTTPRVQLLATILEGNGNPRVCMNQSPGSPGATFSKPAPSSSKASDNKKTSSMFNKRSHEKEREEDPRDNEPGFPCPNCDLKFNSGEEREKHRRSAHPTLAELCLDLQPGIAGTLQAQTRHNNFSIAWIYPYLVYQLPITNPHTLSSFAYDFTLVISSEKTINEIINELVLILEKRGAAEWRQIIFRSFISLIKDPKRKTHTAGRLVQAYLRDRVDVDVKARPWNLPLQAYSLTITSGGELQRGQMPGIETAYQHLAQYFADGLDSRFTFSKQELEKLIEHVVQALSSKELLGKESPGSLVSSLKQQLVDKNYTMGDVIHLIHDSTIINNSLFFAGLFIVWEKLSKELQDFLSSFIEEEKNLLKKYYENTQLEQQLGSLYHFLLLFTRSYWPGQDAPDFKSMLVQKAASET